MRVVVTGATGLIGGALAASLAAAGHRVDRVSRRPAAPGSTDIQWDPEHDRLDATRLRGAEAVVHLAGENIAARRWTPAHKARVRESRVRSTRLLAEAVARLREPPEVLVTASGVSYYGDRKDEILTEDSAPGTGFLADVCQEWEAAADPARAAGVRVVHLRIGLVLSAAGGALPAMLRPFRLGLGGVVGSGRQYWSWIALPDLVRAIEHALDVEALAGPVNGVGPAPATNREFTRALGRVLRRPTLLPLPARAVRLLFGEMGQALLLASTRVRPERLEGSGFRFEHAELEPTLRTLLRPRQDVTGATT
jgi:uncharacterized protein (TIGR01777 family)